MGRSYINGGVASCTWIDIQNGIGG